MVSEKTEKKVQVKTSTKAKEPAQTAQAEPKTRSQPERDTRAHVEYEQGQKYALSALASEVKDRLKEKDMEMTNAFAETFVREVFYTIEDILLSRCEVRATGFGTFYLLERPARTRRVPFVEPGQPPRTVEIEADAVLKFHSPYTYDMSGVPIVESKEEEATEDGKEPVPKAKKTIPTDDSEDDESEDEESEEA